MKIQLRFSLEKKNINLDYRRLVLSFLKNAIQQYDPKKYENYYGANSTIRKKYCYDIILPEPHFTKEKVDLGDNQFSVVIGTSDMVDGIDLYNAIHKQKKKEYPMAFGNKMRLEKVYISNHKEIQSNEIIVQMLQPLLLRDHNRETNKDVYYTADPKRQILQQSDTSGKSAEAPQQFNEMFKKLINYQLEKAGEIKDDTLEIIPIKPSSTIVKAYSGQYPASIGTYYLKGRPETLNYLYQTGLGSRSSGGFGVFEVIDQKKEV